jgi:hypothetical protein
MYMFERHAAWECSMKKQHGLAAGSCNKDIPNVDKHLGHATRTHSQRTCRQDMHFGHAA